ncbi:hypothetical protein GCM10011390_01360 [Aureimonas endophytica]|uniref:CYTH domain-containing protein n=1 Tax=Aureimonas endophytica TaxID=2027858 RepID=A0A916ZBL9_9HYPH|nr:CYTH domain-containing protein [Aureimonas endophytica]GGD86466.1 hypothetical protein GCM10011390_01360 [Aureimonas endophytica]
MRFEIERKFLVKDHSWRPSAISWRPLRDGLISQSEGSKVRVRIDDAAAWLTVKGKRLGIARPEYEYEIPIDDAENLIRNVCTGHLIEKTRHFVPHGADMWIVDTFHGRLEGLVWAEIELEDEGQTFARPNWLGDEVTGDPRFRHSTLLSLCETGTSPISLSEILSAGFSSHAEAGAPSCPGSQPSSKCENGRSGPRGTMPDGFRLLIE